MRNIFTLIIGLVTICLSMVIDVPLVRAAGGMVWHKVQLTDGINNAYNPNITTDGSRLYYVYTVDNGSGNLQLWTAVSDMGGDNFTATQRTTYTTPGVLSASENIEVAGGKVIYSWIERKSPSVREVWTASMDSDGNNWVAVQQTNDGNNIKVHTSMDIQSGKVFLAWHQTGLGNSIYTAIMNTDGSGFVRTKRTADFATNENPQILATNARVFVLWREWENTYTYARLKFGYMNFDGTDFTIVDLTDFSALRVVNDITTDGSYIYAVWYEGLNSHQRLMYSRINFDGTGFNEQLLHDKPYTPPLPADDYDFIPHIDYDTNQIYITWEEYYGSGWDIFTGVLDLDDGEFRPTQRLTDSTGLARARFAINGDVIYYAYTDFSGVATIYLAIENNIDTREDGAIVTATVPSSLEFTIDGITAGNACANSGGNASVTTTATSIPFGTYAGAQTKIACQTLTVSTNAGSGYIVSLQQNRDLTNANSNTMGKFTGTYAVPAAWTSPISPNKSFFGFTTDDTDLANFQSEKYSQLAANNTPYTIIQETTSVADEVNTISYQLEVNNLQEAGIYSNTLMYIVTVGF